ncbi:MAG: hypothetical protein L0H82_02490 [Lactobacillus sp.]|nr:hypothetical protein [Lactobacillus sp.]
MVQYAFLGSSHYLKIRRNKHWDGAWRHRVKCIYLNEVGGITIYIIT